MTPRSNERAPAPIGGALVILALGFAGCSQGDEDRLGLDADQGSSAGGSTGTGGSGSEGQDAPGGDGGSAPHASGGSVPGSGGNPSGGAIPSGGTAADAGGTTSADGGAPSTGGMPAASGGTPQGSGGAPQAPTAARSIYIASDSTVSTYPDTPSPNDQAGWGQMLGARYSELITVKNHAVGGRTARRFIDEGRLDAIWAELEAGDYLLVQFGTNDGHATATYEIDGQVIPYYLDPNTDFKRYLEEYIDGAAARDAHIVLVTPPPRNSAYCTGGNGTGAHAQAMRELAEERDVPLSDLNQKTVDLLEAICPAPTPEDFFFVRTDGSVDGTHFQENGARIMSGFVAEGIAEAKLPLALYAKGPEPSPEKTKIR